MMLKQFAGTHYLRMFDYKLFVQEKDNEKEKAVTIIQKDHFEK